MPFLECCRAIVFIQVFDMKMGDYGKKEMSRTILLILGVCDKS